MEHHAGFGAKYALDVEQKELEPAKPVEFRFRVLGPDGKAVTSYRPLHERELHLIVVRQDLATFSHLHPAREPDGTWTVELTLPSPGPYRAFTDLAPTGGPDLTLAVDLTAPGEWVRQELPAPSRTAKVDDFLVELSGALVAGAHSELTFTVTRRGERVPLEPYLGALGHLVALRASDLAYLHVHPLEDSATDAVRFGVEVPSAERYRLFLQFVHTGRVRTAAFTVEASQPSDRTETAENHGPHGAAQG